MVQRRWHCNGRERHRKSVEKPLDNVGTFLVNNGKKS